MRISSLRAFAALLLSTLASSLSADPTQSLDPDYEAPWYLESRETLDERIGWYKEAKFGMFIHWGVYAGPGGVWQGQVKPGYSEHIFRHFDIPLEVYKDEVAGRFNPTEYDADEWVRLAQEAGMKYVVITSKHHDGFALWPSAIGDWDIDEASPFQRDPLRELREACERHGLYLGFYYSQAWDWSHPFGQSTTWEWPYQPDEKNWWDNPDYFDYVELSERYVREKSIPQLVELILRYHPKLIWFDTPDWLPPYQNQMILKALRKTDPGILVNGRIGSGMGDYATTSDQPDDFQHYYRHHEVWEAIPTTNNSYGYHQTDDTHKPASFFIQLFAKAVEKGGNLLMNIGPRADGTIDPTDQEILREIGDWLETNGEAVYGTSRSPLPLQAWGQVSRKGHRLYLHVTNWPLHGEILLGGLETPIKKAWLLSDPSETPLPFQAHSEHDWLIRGPAHAPDLVNTVVVVECEGEPMGAERPVILSTRVGRQQLHFFDGEPRGLHLGNGNYRHNFPSGWTPENSEAALSWTFRTVESADFLIKFIYVAWEGRHDGVWQVDLNSYQWRGQAEKLPPPEREDFTLYPETELGVVHLEPGVHTVRVTAVEITGDEFIAPQSIVFYRP